MKKIILLSAIVIVGCKNSPKKEMPLWVSQNIDAETDCNIIPCPQIKIIKVGNAYTATYTFDDYPQVWFKVNKQQTGLDFEGGNAIQYFTDSCLLKNDLRGFIKLQMVKFISNIK